METIQHRTRDTVHLTADEAYALIQRGLAKGGYSAEEIKIIADHLIDNALCGYDRIAFPRVIEMVANAKARPDRTIKVDRITPVSARVHGAFESGYISHYRATMLGIEIAREHGFALIGVNDSVSSGRIAYYMEIIGRAGLVGLQFTGGNPIVAPHGSATPVFGTNPIAAGLPLEPNPVVLDLGTSATNGGDVRLARKLGFAIPDDVAIDADGNTTRDPNAVKAILPFGGYKGSGLSFLSQILGMLAGAPLTRDGKRGWGSLFIIFKPELFMPAEEWKERLNQIIAEIKGGKVRPGVDQIRIPGERGFAERERARKAGVDIDREIYDAINALT